VTKAENAIVAVFVFVTLSPLHLVTLSFVDRKGAPNMRTTTQQLVTFDPRTTSAGAPATCSPCANAARA
jgi:hypothetical protein